MRLPLVLCAIALAVAAWASAASAADPVRATMKTSTTKPLVDEPWRYTITVKDRAKRPVAARVRVQVLLGQLVVGCWKVNALASCSAASAGTWISFTGRHTGTIVWPAHSAGVELTFQAIVVAKQRPLRLRAPVIVQRP